MCKTMQAKNLHMGTHESEDSEAIFSSLFCNEIVQEISFKQNNMLVEEYTSEFNNLSIRVGLNGGANE